MKIVFLSGLFQTAETILTSIPVRDAKILKSKGFNPKSYGNGNNEQNEVIVLGLSSKFCVYDKN